MLNSSRLECRVNKELVEQDFFERFAAMTGVVERSYFVSEIRQSHQYERRHRRPCSVANRLGERTFRGRRNEHGPCIPVRRRQVGTYDIVGGG